LIHSICFLLIVLIDGPSSSWMYVYIILIDFLVAGTADFPLRNAKPGEIVLQLQDNDLLRVTPVGVHLKSTGVDQLKYMSQVVDLIDGERVRLLVLGFGLYIRADDFESLQEYFRGYLFRNSQAMPAMPQGVLRIAVRAMWPGQSYTTMLKLSDEGVPEPIPFKDLPPFHTRRLTVLAGTYFSINFQMIIC
jgi:hypothetical protein